MRSSWLDIRSGCLTGKLVGHSFPKNLGRDLKLKACLKGCHEGSKQGFECAIWGKRDEPSPSPFCWSLVRHDSVFLISHFLPQHTEKFEKIAREDKEELLTKLLT